MSQVYVNEPPTLGKVCLETSVGEIEIELFSRECPKACRNFVQLCMENYYDRTKFHRVVRDFIVQGGDPTGTGQGGESIYGQPFKDEFHSRLRFNRRGLVGMANAGKDDNGSQFFFTMGETGELNNKHTLFGKVVGATVFNMIKLQDGELEDDRPVHPNKILRTKVLINPFPDIEPRKLIKMETDEEREKNKKPKSKMKATKDFKLLSFGEEAEEEEDHLKDVQSKFKSTSKSSHDLLNDPKLLKDVGLDIAADDYVEEERESRLEKTSKVADIDNIRNKLSKKSSTSSKSKNNVDKDDFDDADEGLDEKEKKRAEILREIKALKKDLKADKNGEKEEKEETGKGKKRTKSEEEEESNDLLKSLKEEKLKYISKSKLPKKGSAREEMTMSLLRKFTDKLRSVPEESEDASTKTDVPKVDAKEEDDDDELAGDSWMGHKLSFEAERAILAKDANTKGDDWFDIYDPRNPVNKRRREQNKKK